MSDQDRWAMAPTDARWFAFLSARPELTRLNFWTPTPWNISGLRRGARLYFLLKGQQPRRVAGYAHFESYQNLCVDQAWDDFGIGNGVESRDTLAERIADFATRRSVSFDPSRPYRIGCIAVTDPVYFNPQDRPTADELGVSFPPQVVKIKYFEPSQVTASERSVKRSTAAAIDIETLRRSLLQMDELEARRTVLSRAEQRLLRKLLLADRKTAICDVCGHELPSELLWVAHIKPRAECTTEEKLDYAANLILACKLGCDDLFEKGYLVIREGHIKRGPRVESTPELDAHLSQMIDRPSSCWTPERARYFAAHERIHAAGRFPERP